MSFYTKSVLIFIVTIIFSVLLKKNVSAEDLEKFEVEEIVPDIIDSVPQFILNVTYEDDIEVNLGNKLSPMQVRNVPNITWDADSEKLYLLIMIDADIPSRQEPTYREGQHYVVGNIPGMDISQGEVLAEYVGSGPPKGSGLHRYIFLLYEQPTELTFDETRLTKKAGIERAKFFTRKFATKYELGEPIGGNFYQAEWDEYVNKLHIEHSEN